MKTWQKYKQYLLSGEWHIHTNYTDGNNSVVEYCEKALEHSIPLLAFTEHVRKELRYDFSSLLEEIDKARAEYSLIILSGCEVKVLPDGSLDVVDDIIKEVDYPVFAFHSFPKNFDLFLDCLKSAITNKYINTWAHPSIVPINMSTNIDSDVILELFKLMKEYNVLLEYNNKYNLPPQSWIKLAKEIDVLIVRGSDVHSITDLRAREKIFLLRENVEGKKPEKP